eukprot:3651245-Rhodomonas_salina.1
MAKTPLPDSVPAPYLAFLPGLPTQRTYPLTSLPTWPLPSVPTPYLADLQKLPCSIRNPSEADQNLSHDNRDPGYSSRDNRNSGYSSRDNRNSGYSSRDNRNSGYSS